MDELEKYIDKSDLEQIDRTINRDNYLVDYALGIACKKGNIKVVKHFVESGVNLNSFVRCPTSFVNKSYSLMYPIEITASSSNEDLTVYLVQNGTDAKKIGFNYASIIQNFSLTTIQLLLDSGMSTDHLIEYSAEIDRSEVFIYLHNRLTNVDLTKIWIVACRNNSVRIINYLLESGSEPDWSNKNLIYYLLVKTSYNMVKKTLNRVSDPNKILIPGSLKCACISDDPKKVRLVLDYVPDTNNDVEWLDQAPGIIDMTDIKSLNIAIENQSMEIVQLLVNHGAKIDFSCLKKAVLGWDWSIFELIYNSYQVTRSELFQLLFLANYKSAFNPGFDSIESNKMFLFLHQEYGFLDDDKLGEIIKFCNDNKLIKYINYLMDFYGEDRVKSLMK